MKLINIGYGNMVSSEKIVTESDHIVMSALSPEAISNRTEED